MSVSLIPAVGYGCLGVFQNIFIKCRFCLGLMCLDNGTSDSANVTVCTWSSPPDFTFNSLSEPTPKSALLKGQISS